MNDFERTILARLLQMAADQFSNHGCNDFDLPDSDEARELIHAYHEWNGDPEEADEYQAHRGKYMFTDFVLMRYFAKRFAKPDESLPTIIMGRRPTREEVEAAMVSATSDGGVSGTFLVANMRDLPLGYGLRIITMQRPPESDEIRVFRAARIWEDRGDAWMGETAPNEIWRPLNPDGSGMRLKGGMI